MIKYPADYPAPAGDVLSITILDDGQVVGFGQNNQVGKYTVAGLKSNLAIAFLYRDDSPNQDYLGGVILQVETPDKMKGEWLQFPGAQRRVQLYGTVEMQRETDK